MIFIRNSLAAIDFSLAISMFVCTAASLVVALLPVLRSSFGLLSISVLSTGAIYRRAILGYVAINLFVYLIIVCLSRVSKATQASQKLRWRWSCLAMLVLLVIFLAGRQYQLETRPVAFLGVNVFLYGLNMWSFLRLTTLLWEFGSGRVERPCLLSYVSWVALPFTLLGPILRYSQFERHISSAGEQAKTIENHWTRWWRSILIASAQILLALLLSGFQLTLTAAGNGLPRWEKVVILFSLAPWSFYLLWAGYFTIMEKLALFWGLELPPSFNRPFGRRNLSEFWANWNMTATSVFRDYFFYNRWGLPRVNLYLNTLIVFLMVGIWHGLNGYWVLWGLLHGIGFCSYLWYRNHKALFTSWRGKRFELPISLTSRVATYLYVCSCWFLPPTILKLMR